MEQYGWSEMLHYWRSHNQTAARVDWESDPDGLTNVCQSSIGPVNRYYHRSQLRTLDKLIAGLLPPSPGAQALDVGCGAGRWCRHLAKVGFGVTGIDLQEELIDANHRHDPHIRYVSVAVRDFDPERPFDLITSVTVLQHLPFPEQRAAARRIAGMLAPRGNLAILENISDRSSSVVFPHRVRGWIELFEDEGLSVKSVLGYDYSPSLRSYYWLTRALRQRYFRPDEDDRLLPKVSGVPGRGDIRIYARRADRGIRVGASTLDSVLEPLFISRQPMLSTGHCAILFGRTK